MRKHHSTASYTGTAERVHDRIIYVVQFGAGTPLKIGSTSDIGARLSKMSVDHYHEPSMLYLAHGGFKEERALHARFAKHRVRGEWYRPDPEMLAWCEADCQRQLVEELTSSLDWLALRKLAQAEERAPRPSNDWLRNKTIARIGK
jgi:hypothetical protein